MTALSRIAALTTLLLLAAGAGEIRAQSRPSLDTFSDRYGVLSERNIFRRERSRSASSRREPTSRPASTPRAPEQTFALTGIVFEDGEFRAYVENLANSSVLKVRVGESLARGTVSEIRIDALEYEQAGRRVWVDIGRNLAGGQVSSMLDGGSPTGSDSTTQPSSTAIGNPNDPNLSLEEKMRLRRQQELNRK